MMLFERLVYRLMLYLLMNSVFSSATFCDEYRELSMVNQSDKENFIFSPNYPHQTPKNYNCSYIFRFNQAGRLCLHFLQFDLEGFLAVEAHKDYSQTRVGKAEYYRTGESVSSETANFISTNELLLPNDLKSAPLCFQGNLGAQLALRLSTRFVSKGFLARFETHKMIQNMNNTCPERCLGNRYIYTTDGQRQCTCKADNAAPCINGNERPCYAGYCQFGGCKNNTLEVCSKDWFGVSSSTTYAWSGCADQVSCTFEHIDGLCSSCETQIEKSGGLRNTKSDHSQLDRSQSCILSSRLSVISNKARVEKTPILTITLAEFKDAKNVCFRFWWRSQAVKIRFRNIPKVYLVLAQQDTELKSFQVVLALHGFMSNYINSRGLRVWNKAEIDITSATNSSFKNTMLSLYTLTTQEENVVNENVFDIDDLSILPGDCLNYKNTIGSCSFESSTCSWVSSTEKNWTRACNMMDHTSTLGQSVGGCAWTLPLNSAYVSIPLRSAVQVSSLNEKHCLSMWYKTTNRQLKVDTIGRWQIDIINVASLIRLVKPDISSMVDSSGWTFLSSTLSIVPTRPFYVSIGFQTFEKLSQDAGVLILDDISISIGACNSTLYYASRCDPRLYFRCKNENCIDSRLLCNRIDNCGDNSDEENTRCQKQYLPQVLTAIGVAIMCVILLGLWGKACESKIMKFCRHASQRRIHLHPENEMDGSSTTSTQLEQAFELQARRNDEYVADVNCDPPNYSECMQQQQQQSFINESFKLDDLPPPEYATAIFMTTESVRNESPNATIVIGHGATAHPTIQPQNR